MPGKPRALLSFLLACAVTAPGHAGVFLTSTPGRVTHAGAYTGSGGERVVEVCLDPTALPLAGDPAQATRNAIAEFNRFQGTLGNVGSAVAAGVPGGALDYQSFLMHEMGHCLGLDHNVLGPSEVACNIGGGTCVNNPALFFVNSTPGINGVRDTLAGIDGARGTGDDVRFDDVNRHWYRANSNFPFVEPPVADRTTYVQSGSLPPGDLYAEAVANFSPCAQGTATSNTGAANGQPTTQDVLFPVLCTSNVVRDLSPNDRTTWRIARAGMDGVAGTGDDYSVRLVYIGTTQAGCDVQIRFPSGGGFFCAAGLIGLGNGDTSVSDTGDADSFAAVINLQRESNWYFNPVDTTGAADPVFCNGLEGASTPCVFP